MSSRLFAGNAVNLIQWALFLLPLAMKLPGKCENQTCFATELNANNRKEGDLQFGPC